MIISKKLKKYKNISHGFFNSSGGVSKGIYKSLNCGIGSKDKKQNILIVKIDTRLFFEILKGPRYAHWNNAEIGSHIKYFRNPDSYDRGLFYCMNFLHS